MAFIRDYAWRDQGDPFRFRIPKKLRKLKVGRALGKVARFAAPFIPGVGGIAAQMLAPQEQAAVAEAAALPAPDEEAQVLDPRREAILAFARSYGYELGDPVKGKGSKRKMAGAGPAAKAAKKKDKRIAKASGAAPKKSGSSARGKGAGKMAALGNVLQGLNTGLGKITGAGGSLFTGGMTDLAGDFGSSLAYKGGRSPFGGGHRRSMNPANVHALRRSLRRVEGFEKLVKRIEKQYPRLKRATGHAHTTGRGHKAGCRCAVCK